MNKRSAFIGTVLIFILTVMTACSAIQHKSGIVDALRYDDTTSISESEESAAVLTETIPSETFPVTESTSAPETEPEIIEDIREISILAIGDIMSHGDNLKSAYNPKTNEYSFIEPFKFVKPIIEKADFAIANLETVTAGEEAAYSSYPLFNTPAAIIDALKYSGFDMLITANNHSLDRGRDGIIKTINEIDKRELFHTGTYKEAEDRVFYTDIKGFRLAVISYTYGCNGNLPRLSKEEQEYMVNIINEDKIKNDIESAEKNKADIIIVYLHWGVEYIRTPERYQELFAKRLFTYGADIIFGTHPHVVQKSEVMEIEGKDRYIIYSLGNFLHNFRRSATSKRPNTVYTEDAVMAIATFEKDFANKDSIAELTDVTHIPTWLDRYYENGSLEYRVIPNPDNILDGEYITDTNIDRIRASYKHTMELVSDFSREQNETED